MDSQQLMDIFRGLLPDPFYCKNTKGEYLHVNEAFARLAGTDARSITGKKVRDLFSGVFVSADESSDSEVLGGRDIAIYDTEIGEGEVRRFFSCRKIRVLDGEGSPDVIAGIMTETTTLRKAEESLRNYSLAVEESPASIVITDASGTIQYVNSTFTRVTGYSAREAVGQDPRILKSGIQSKEFYKSMWNTISSGMSWKGEFHNKKRNGDLFWEIASISPITDKSGNITSYIAVKEDITHLKAIEEELRRSEEKNREILDAIPDIMFKMDRSGTCLDESLAGKIAEVFPDVVRKVSLPHIEKAFETAQIQIFEYPVTGDGPPLFYEARFIISGEDEILAIIRNITERVRAEQEMKAARQAAENASRSKSDFLANMSHEIRTPLNSITGFIELLKKTSPSPGQAEYLDIIDRSAENLVGIINDILDFSKIESGKIEIESIAFNPFHEFEPTIEVFTEKAQKKNIALYSFLDPALPPEIIGDPLRIKQVLINLLSNAIKFTPEGGKIFIEITRAGEAGRACDIHFSVRDTGIGIPERKQKLIFEAFSQADSSVTRRYGGTGLGLSISSNLIVLMGSTLMLDSHPGRGSTFHFVLHMEKCEATTDHGFPEDFRAYIHCPDSGDKNLKELLERYLRSFGPIPVHVSGPGGIREEAGRGIIFLIRPDSAGDEFDALTKSFRAGGLRLVAVTGTLSPPDPGAAPSSADRTIQAPLNPSRIFNAIVELLDMPAVKKIGAERKSQDAGARFDAVALVAEDNPVNQKLITLILQGYGITADVASNGHDAFYMSGARAYDIIFMDVNMPVTDGVEATQMILVREKESGTKHVPIIALTAMAIKGDRERLLAAGMDDYLSKPIDTKKLVKVLGNWLPRRREGAPQAATRTEPVAPVLPPDRIDMEKTAAELGIPPGVLKKIIVEFLSGSDEYIDGLSSAVESEDMKTLNQAAHRLKGAAANLRLREVAELAGRIEVSSKSAGGEEYGYLIAQIRSRLEALRRGMQ
jgi:PAS domain S-box-containing protein